MPSRVREQSNKQATSRNRATNEDMARQRPDAGGPAHNGAMQLQRTLGNREVGRLLSEAGSPGGVVQRLTTMEAGEAIRKARIDHAWYHTVAEPALSTIAAKAGQTLDEYLQGMTKKQFLEQVRQLNTGMKQEPRKFSLKNRPKDGMRFIDSKAYPGMVRLEGANLLINPRDGFRDGEPTQELLNFIDAYQNGTLEWYRGLSISHFAWESLRMGVLASEGTRDIPTFTMDANTPTRWLPGVNTLGMTEGIARTIARDDAGLRDLATRMEIPTGAVVKYTVPPDAPVAYLNDGEQVVRGPISGGNISVHAVYLLGPDSLRLVAQGASPTELPPAAPYRAAKDSDQINDWAERVTSWLTKVG